jgi:hypothetical protein
MGKRAPAHGPDVVVTYQSPSGPAARASLAGGAVERDRVTAILDQRAEP